MREFNYFFLDRDGVINENNYVNSPSDFTFIDSSLEAFEYLHKTGCDSIIITNQGGIEAGYLTEATLLEIHREMLSMITAAGGDIKEIYYCPHLEFPCECRKPKPGLIERAMKFNSLLHRKKDCCFIGDFITDWQAAEAAGIQPIAVKTGRYEEPEVAEYVAIQRIPLYENLLAAVHALADTIPF